MNNEKKNKGKLAAIAGLLLCAAIMLAAVIGGFGRGETPQETAGETFAQTQPGVEATEAGKPAIAVLPEGLEVISIGSYTGVYMEDGSDEVLAGILMMKVTNTGETPIQYAEITMTLGEEQADFSLSTLNPGAEMVLLEQNRRAYDGAADYENADISAKNVALFKQPMLMHEDKLQLQILDGAINVTNISGGDIGGNIAIYYKNAAAGVYYGGITYRITLEGGLKAGEVRQLMASHFSDTGSEIMFVTIA